MIDVKAHLAASKRGRRVEIQGPDGEAVALFYRPVEGNTEFQAELSRLSEDEMQATRVRALATLSEEEVEEARRQPFGPVGMRVWTAAKGLPEPVREGFQRGLAAEHLLTGWEDGGAYVPVADPDPVVAKQNAETAAALVGIDWVWIGLREAAFRSPEIEMRRVAEAISEAGAKKAPASTSSGSSNGEAPSTQSDDGKPTPKKSRAGGGKRRSDSTSPNEATPSPKSSSGDAVVAT